MADKDFRFSVTTRNMVPMECLGVWVIRTVVMVIRTATAIRTAPVRMVTDTTPTIRMPTVSMFLQGMSW